MEQNENKLFEIAKELSGVAAKLDMLLQRIDRQHDENTERFQRLESRVDQLESTKDTITGKLSMIVFGVSAATSAVIGGSIKWFMDLGGPHP